MNIFDIQKDRFAPWFILSLFLFFFSFQAFSQKKYINLETYNVDSLLAILPVQVNEERVNSLNYLAVSLSFIDFNKSKYYADEAMDLARKLSYEEGIAAAFRNYGQMYVYQGYYHQALSNYLEALSIYEMLEIKHTEGWVNFEIAKTHFFASNYEKAIEYALIALDIFQERSDNGTIVGNARDLITIYGGLGETYAVIGMNEKSLEYDLKALDLMRRNNYKNVELMMETFHTGAQYFQLRNLDSAKAYFFKALAFPDESMDIITLKYRNIIYLGRLYKDAVQIDSALYYFNKGFKFYDEKGFLYWALKTSINLGSIYYENNNLDLAEKYLKKSERIFMEMLTRNSWYRNDSISHIANYGLELYIPIPPVRLKEMIWMDGQVMYKLLYQLNDANKQTREAYRYYIAYSKAKDSVYTLKQNREAIEMQTRYETERKDQQILTLSLQNDLKASSLERNRYFLYGSFGLLILIIMFGYILFRQNRLKTVQKMTLLQQKLLRSQMNPHFIFNSLTSIQSFITDRNPRNASRYLSMFAKLIRNILDSSTEEFVRLSDEITTIENYLELQKLRYADKFDYTIDVDEHIDDEAIILPPMLAQPFIENTIEHGFKYKDNKGKLKIRISSMNGFISFEVEDDGIGRERAKEVLYKQNKDHKSLATTITYERIRVLNKKLKRKIQLHIIDLKNEENEPSGTKVQIEIPC